MLAIVLWIGGVAMSTLVLLPALARADGGAGLFAEVERRFAAQTRWTILIAGASGLYLVARLGLWSRFAEGRFWWMHAMVALWLLYAAALFVLEPLWLRRRFAARAAHDPRGALRRMQRHHWLVLVLSLATVFAVTGGSHGMFG
ncbi:MAG TPA: hypothetical protein VEV21_13885 [Burkholderiales bacterium]|nr:hypothetical protein [Burkholderiales bacterium]